MFYDYLNRKLKILLHVAEDFAHPLEVVNKSWRPVLVLYVCLGFEQSQFSGLSLTSGSS